MFLAKSAALLFSFSAHTIGLVMLVAASAAPAPALPPSLDPPCATLTWISTRVQLFPPGPPAIEQVSDLLPEITLVSGPGTLSLAVDEAPAIGTRGGEIGGVCGCQVGGIVSGDAGIVPGAQIARLDPLPLVSETFRAGDDVPLPAKIVDVQPRYPPLAKQLRLDGVVVLDATIDESGSVVDVRTLRSMTAFDRAAIEAVRQWRYAPAMRNGLPVRILLTVTVSFTHPV